MSFEVAHAGLELALLAEPKPVSAERLAELVHAHRPEDMDYGRQQKQRAATAHWLEHNGASVLRRINGTK